MSPFPFIGEGASKRAEVWVVTSQQPASELAAHFPEAKLRHEGRVALLSWKAEPDELGELLQVVHHALPLSLVVRPGRVKGTAWHRASLQDARVFPALEALVKEAPSYAGRLFPLGGSRDVTVQLFEALEGRAPRAEVLTVVVRALLDANPGKSRPALTERLEEALPALVGSDFAVDVAVRYLLAQLRGVAANTVKLTAAFDAEFARQLKGTHGKAAKQKEGALDWSSRDAVLSAVAAERWDELSKALREQDDSHIETVRSLEPDTLLKLATQHRDLPTQLANIATSLLPQNEVDAVLRLYDAAIEGRLHPLAAGNPLYCGARRLAPPRCRCDARAEVPRALPAPGPEEPRSVPERSRRLHGAGRAGERPEAPRARQGARLRRAPPPQ
jgi:hypothetical protein